MAISKIKLGQIGEIRMCKRILKSETSEHGDVPFYKIGTFGETADVFISREKFEEYKVKYNYPKVGDILLSAAGTIGRTVRYNGEDAYFQDSNIVWIENDETIVLNDYLYYVLKYKKWQPSTGSTILRLYNDDIRNTEVVIHTDLKTQDTIASILSSLDRKISLNRKANEVLESMAKQLYDYWFVQFDFPNAEGKPYKSSGGKMVYNETLKREIPEGWEVEKICQVADTFSGGTPNSSHSEYYEGGKIPWINSGELNDKFIVSAKSFITEEGLKNSSAKYYPENSVLVAMYGATAGKVSYLAFKATSNQAICGVMPKNNKLIHYVYFFLSSLYNYFSMSSTGSARDNISQGLIKETDMLIPNNINSFHHIIDPLFRTIISNEQETLRLTSLRDYLLPLLMNGQVKVS